MFLPPLLIPACNSSSPAFLMMCSAYRLNKQGDSRQPYFFLNLEPISCSIQGSNCMELYNNIVCVCVSCAQLCPTLWDSMDYSLPGFSVHGISQARILVWVAISSSRGSS